jgi:predicted house-cleaning noncanonical NTP pyrophosphatase (MazG superfamily)
MKKTYNKLVRDRIPDIIRQVGKAPSTRVASPGELRALLDAKLDEELAELRHPSANRPDELADIMEVVHALGRLEGLAPEALELIRKKKADERGGFRDGIVLLEVEE